MDWLEEELGGFDDEYLIIDCPGRFNFKKCFITAANLIYYRRPDRTLYAPPISSNACSKPCKDGNQSIRCLSDRVSIHGGSI